MTETTLRCWIAALAAFLPGCVSYEPNPLDPPLELRVLAMRAKTDVMLDLRGGWDASWFPLTRDVGLDDGITLAEANALALFYAPSVRSARARTRIAGAQVLQAGVLANPNLFLGPRISTDNSNVIFPAGLSWQLPLWGARGADREAARANESARRLQVLDVELDALVAVRAGFLRLERLMHEEVIAERNAGLSEQIIEWVERLRRAGEVDASVAYLALAERDEASVALAVLRTRIKRARRELLAALGLLPDAPVRFTIDREPLPELPDTADDALLALPSVRAAQASHAQAEAVLRREIARQFPSLRLGPEFEDDAGDPSIGFGLGVTLPVFNRNRGNVLAALEARDAALENYRAELLRAAHAEARARDDLEMAEELLRIRRRGALQEADGALRTLELRLRAGRVDILELLSARRAIATAQTEVLALEERAAIARLNAAIEGGHTLRSPQPRTSP